MLKELLKAASMLDAGAMTELCERFEALAPAGVPEEPNYLRQALWGCGSCLRLAYQDALLPLESMLSLVATADESVWSTVRAELCDLVPVILIEGDESDTSVLCSIVLLALVAEITARRGAVDAA